MNETLRLLYDRFYTPLPMVESEQEVETCHRQLIERLDKPERKLVLRIIDAQNLMIEQRSVDSFICGFRLAWEMANELNHYMEERPRTLFSNHLVSSAAPPSPSGYNRWTSSGRYNANGNRQTPRRQS